MFFLRSHMRNTLCFHGQKIVLMGKDNLNGGNSGQWSSLVLCEGKCLWPGRLVQKEYLQNWKERACLFPCPFLSMPSRKAISCSMLHNPWKLILRFADFSIVRFFLVWESDYEVILSFERGIHYLSNSWRGTISCRFFLAFFCMSIWFLDKFREAISEERWHTHWVVYFEFSIAMICFDFQVEC